MDTINVILTLYKDKLAEANHQNILAIVQCEEYRRKIEQQQKEIEDLKAQLKALREEGEK